MKRKLSSFLMVILVTLTVCVPVFAGDSGDTPGDDCREDYLWQLIIRLWCGCGTQNGDEPEQQEQQRPEEQQKPEEQKKPEKQQKPETQDEAPQAQTQDGISEYEREVVRLVNLEREKAGLAPLELDAGLSRVARMKSQDMHDRGYFDHNSPTYGTPFQLMKSQGIRYNVAGENIAMGYRTPEAVVNAWMNSPGHRANILKESYTKIGVGYVADGSYWTQHFIG